MLYFGSFSFFLYFFYFSLAIFLAWFIPGKVILKKVQLESFSKSILSLIVGLAFWGWQGFLFGYLRLRWLSYGYLVFFLVLFLLKFRFKIPKIDFKRIDWIVVLIICAGVLCQLTQVFFMGTKFTSGIVLCCGHVPDNNLELSIVSELTQHFPPFEPGMYGQPLQNYHYWSHLVTAELIRVFHLPLVATVYQYSTVLYSLLFGLLFLVTSRLLKMKRAYAYWLLFFTYFGGDGSFLISLFQGRGLLLPIGPLEHGAQLFLNYPRAISIIVFLGGFNLFLVWIKDRKLLTGIIMAFVLGCVIGFKVYTGFFVLIACISYGLFLLYKKRIKLIIPLIIVSLLSAVIYIPVNSHAGGLFYTGFWRVNDFIVLPGLQLSHLELAREIYARAGKVPKVFMYEALFTFLYLFVTFGTKIVGLLQTKQSLRLFSTDVHIFLLPSFAVSFILGMFFWQTTGGPNTFNFLVTIIIIGCFYTALASYYWLSMFPKISGIVLGILLIVTTIPRVFSSEIEAIKQMQHPYVITPKEVSALYYLQNNTPASTIYLVDLANNAEYNSPYIPYMTQRASFLSGEIDELEAHGISYQRRLSESQEILASSDSAQVKRLLYKNNISYLYLNSSTKLPVATMSSALQEVFNNGVIKIIKINHQ